jgi:hypothetical protein
MAAKKNKQTVSALLTHETLIIQTAPAAYERVASEILAVPAQDVRRFNLDMGRAARRGTVVAERIEPLHPAMSQLIDLDYRLVSNMGTYAWAVLHTNDLATQGTGDMARLAILLEEATPLRELMLGSGEMLALAGFVSKERVAAIRRGKGNVDTADDLQTLGRLYRELWASVHDKVPVTMTMVERAIVLSAEITKALGGRDLKADPLEQRKDPRYVRAQAFSLFARAYDECRRAVTYLRWQQGDAWEIVPSLYPARGRRVGAGEGEGEAEGEAEGDGPLEDGVDDLLEAGHEDESKDEAEPGSVETDDDALVDG